MRGIPFFRSALALVGVFTVIGCSDLPTSPDPSQSLLGIDDVVDEILHVVGGQQVDVLQRATPLATDEVRTKVIGWRGGRIHLPEAGLTLVFPRGALSEPVSITVTAPAGEHAGYEFQPHGLEFTRSVRAEQDMSKLIRPSGSDRIFAAYFEGLLGAQVNALEILGLRLGGSDGTFAIRHFSGYVIATSK